MTGAEEIVSRARECIGARFRPHGRVPALGLDCVGLVAHAFALDDAPAGYALRGGDAPGICDLIGRFGFTRIREPRPGDLLLFVTGPFQFHLAVVTEAGFVHADAGLARVVETPGTPRWPVVACFRKVR